MKWTTTRASGEWGISYKTLVRRLHGIGLETKKGRTFTTRQVDRALHGDLANERLRKLRLEGDLLDLERRSKDDELFPRAEVEVLVRETWLPMRQALLQMPAELCSRVNPADPQHALGHLEAWVDATLKSTRETVEGMKRRSATAPPRPPLARRR